MKTIEAFDLLVKEMADILKDSDCIREIDRVLPYLEEVVEDLLKFVRLKCLP